MYCRQNFKYSADDTVVYSGSVSYTTATGEQECEVPKRTFSWYCWAQIGLIDNSDGDCVEIRKPLGRGDMKLGNGDPSKN